MDTRCARFKAGRDRAAVVSVSLVVGNLTKGVARRQLGHVVLQTGGRHKTGMPVSWAKLPRPEGISCCIGNGSTIALRRSDQLDGTGEWSGAENRPAA